MIAVAVEVSTVPSNFTETVFAVDAHASTIFVATVLSGFSTGLALTTTLRLSNVNYSVNC